MFDTPDGHRVYWETCGNPDGKPAVVLHGGPGSGCSDWHRRLFDPAAYRVVLFDQRGCGRSTPHAGRDQAGLDANTTWHLIADIEAMREQLGIARWLVWGGSWGSVLGLAYAQRYPQRVTEMVLWGIGTARRSEEDWLFRGGLSMFFPREWQRLVDELPDRERDDAVAGYRRLLANADPGVRRRAADAWCLWESATPDWPPRSGLASRFTDPAYAMAFARLVHPLRASPPVDRGWSPAAWYQRPGRCSGCAGAGALRRPGAAGVGLGAAPGLAPIGVGGGGERRAFAGRRRHACGPDRRLRPVRRRVAARVSWEAWRWRPRTPPRRGLRTQRSRPSRGRPMPACG
jgi:proline iminopeptidase